MILNAVRVQNFKCINDSTSFKVDEKVTYLVGKNESGKTTFFHLLHSLIFGLYPASKDKHPYTPWNGRDIDVEAEIRLE